MAETVARTPLYVIGGSLGSGKTTLLRRLLAGEYGRLAVIINEFGEIGIDGRLIEGRDIDMVELAGGCVCCSLAGEFAAGVRELLEQARPEAILVETTGVAEADALVEDIEADLPELRLEALVVLVDADTASRFPELGYVERNQLEAADLVLINKTDLAERGAVEALRARIEGINPTARLIETVRAAIDPALVLADPGRAARAASAQRREPGAARAGEATHAHGMESFLWRPSGGAPELGTPSLRRAAFEDAVANWPRQVYRAKGWIRIEGEPMLFNYVAGRWQLEPDRAARTVLVFIGPDIDQVRREVIASVEACLE